MKKINFLIHKFLFLLRSFWPEIEKIASFDTTNSFKEDWLQANWELIVEGPLGAGGKLYLEVYGDGADANGASSRVLEPSALPSHAIYCLSKTGEPILDYLSNNEIDLPNMGIPFDRFVTLGDDGWYYEKNPFDKVLFEINNQQVVVDISELKFLLKDIR